MTRDALVNFARPDMAQTHHALYSKGGEGVEHAVEGVDLGRPVMAERGEMKAIVYPVTVTLSETHDDGSVFLVRLEGHVIGKKRQQVEKAKATRQWI
jgi:hypothetical protein